MNLYDRGKQSYDKILGYVKTLTIIDSHEHLPGREAFRDPNADVLSEYLSHYFSSDLMAMGMGREQLAYVQDTAKPLMERWKLVEPYWMLSENTGYCRALNIAARDIYGIDGINGNTIEELDAAFKKALKPDAEHYNQILKEMSMIEYCILDWDLNCDPKYFKSAYNIDGLVMPCSWSWIEKLENQTGIRISSFEDWLAVCERDVEMALQKGAVTLKCTLAYERPLLFENVTRQEAQACFNKMLSQKGRPIWSDGVLITDKVFQNYMMHFILHLANQKGLVMQVHTGLQEGNHNYIANSDPSLLSNLFVQYPYVKFDLFHMGYPYQHIMPALAKLFPNVYLDMCWAHIISPKASCNALSEWLDSVPHGKIIAYGGDYLFVDGVYAHQLMARENVSKVLAEKVDEGLFDTETACRMAKRMFYDNPKALYEEIR